MGSMSLVGTTESSSGSVVDLWHSTALLHRRESSLIGIDHLSVEVLLKTGNTAYSIIIDDDLEIQFTEGDQILVLVSTTTQRGCLNGFPRIEAIEFAPGSWTPSTHCFPI